MKKDKFIPDFSDVPQKRTRMNELHLEERKENFLEVEKGFTEEQALIEAQRCFSCRRCLGCGLCLAECDTEAIKFDMKDASRETEIDGVIIAPGLDVFSPDKLLHLGYKDNCNIITSIELERILSPTGPYKGILMRPFDGTYPHKIAFIQCIGAREEGLGRDYCGNICCSVTLKHSLEIMKRFVDARITIFYRDMRPYGKEGELQFGEVLDKKSIKLVNCEIDSIRQNDDGQVMITYNKDNNEQEEGFDLAVLSVAQGAEAETRNLARTAGIKINKYGFAEDNSPARMNGKIISAGSFIEPCNTMDAVLSGHAAATALLKQLNTSEVQSECIVPVDGETAILVCEYGLKNIWKDHADSVLKKLTESSFKDLVYLSSFACKKDGTGKLQGMKENDIKRVLLFPCYGINSKMFSLMAQKYNMQGAVVDKSISVEEMIMRHREFFSLPKKKCISQKVLILGFSVSAIIACDTLLDFGKEVIWAFSDSDKEYILPGYKEKYELLSTNRNLALLDLKDIIEVEGDYFKRKIKVSGNEYEADRIIVATSSRKHETEEKPKMISNSQLARRIAENDLSGINKVVFLQCHGSRNVEFPFCSRFCCKETLENALEIRRSYPDCEISIIHRGIRLKGAEEELLTASIEANVNLIKVENEIILDNDKVIMPDGEEIESDLIVLATGSRPHNDLPGISRLLGLELDEGKFLKASNEMGSLLQSSNNRDVWILGNARDITSIDEEVIQGLAIAQIIDESVK
ncbi:MAG: hypothetical protein JXA60_06245 [Candidatus Coatesbacteria bacterium]|nr:hypothetical protein [Candidatus Coatesbacteria bacterium]